MSRRKHKNVNETVNEQVDDDVTKSTSVEDGKETEEVNEKKNVFGAIKDGVVMVVKSTPFKVAVGAAIGVAATIGGKILLDHVDTGCDDFYDDDLDDFDSTGADTESTETESITTTQAEEN